MAKLKEGSTIQYGGISVEYEDGRLRAGAVPVNGVSDYYLDGIVLSVGSDGEITLDEEWERRTSHQRMWEEIVDRFDIKYKYVLRLKNNTPPIYVNTEEHMMDWLLRIAWGAVKVAGLGMNAVKLLKNSIREALTEEDLAKVEAIRRSAAMPHGFARNLNLEDRDQVQ